MKYFVRFLNRIRFRKNIRHDESANIVNGIVKARALYKHLSIIAHPDKNPNQCDIAEDLMSRITLNRFNYTELLKLQDEIKEKLR